MKPIHPFVLCLFVLTPAAWVSGQEPATVNPQLRADEMYLKSQKMQADTESLRNFFKQQTLTADSRRIIQELLDELNNPSFRVREVAHKKLDEQGVRALPQLRAAVQTADPETARRASRLLISICSKIDPEIHLAALRVLDIRSEADTCAVLIAYLPNSFNSDIREAVLPVIVKTGVKSGLLHPSLVLALTDKDQDRRAVSAMLVARFGKKQQQEQVSAMLKDSSPLVRLRAAQGLLAAKRETVIPTLLELLQSAPYPLAEEAEITLQLAAGDNCPRERLSPIPTARFQCVSAWRTWHESKKRTIAWAAIDQGMPWSMTTGRAQHIVRQWVRAYENNDLKGLIRYTDAPFYVGGSDMVFRTRKEVDSLLADALKLSANDRGKVQVTDEMSVAQYLKSHKTRHKKFLAKYAPATVRVVTMRIQQPKQRQQDSSFLVRITGSTPMIVATLDER